MAKTTTKHTYTAPLLVCSSPYSICSVSLGTTWLQYCLDRLKYGDLRMKTESVYKENYVVSYS